MSNLFRPGAPPTNILEPRRAIADDVARDLYMVLAQIPEMREELDAADRRRVAASCPPQD